MLSALLLPVFASAATVNMALTGGSYLCSGAYDKGCQNVANFISLTPPEKGGYHTGDTYNVTCIFKPVSTSNKIKTNIGVIYDAADMSVSSNPEISASPSPDGIGSLPSHGKFSFSVTFTGTIRDTNPMFLKDSIGLYYTAQNNIPESEKGDLLQVTCKNE